MNQTQARVIKVDEIEKIEDLLRERGEFKSAPVVSQLTSRSKDMEVKQYDNWGSF